MQGDTLVTIAEAIEKGIRRVRMDPWNKYCYMLLPEFGKPQGVWAHIIDPCGNVALGWDVQRSIDVLLIAGKTDRIFCCDPAVTACEPWIEPPDFRECFGDPR